MYTRDLQVHKDLDVHVHRGSRHTYKGATRIQGIYMNTQGIYMYTRNLNVYRLLHLNVKSPICPGGGWGWGGGGVVAVTIGKCIMVRIYMYTGDLHVRRGSTCVYTQENRGSTCTQGIYTYTGIYIYTGGLVHRGSVCTQGIYMYTQGILYTGLKGSTLLWFSLSHAEGKIVSTYYAQIYQYYKVLRLERQLNATNTTNIALMFTKEHAVRLT